MLFFLVFTIGCAPGLPKEDNDTAFTLGYEDGYSWGYSLTFEDSNRKDLFWTPPDKVEDAQKFNPKINIRDFYIPKGYLTMDGADNLHFPNGTPFNDKQKEQWIEAYNWGFYSGFKQGCDDCISGKPSHDELLNPIQ
jgi:hypothetical protein